MKTLDSKEVYSGKVLSVRVDRVELPSGRRSQREVVRFPDSVSIIPVTDDGEVLLVKQHRYPVGRDLLEIPAGKVEPGEPPEITARRELLEETGFEAHDWRLLAEFYLAPGYSTEFMSLYVARGLKRTGATPDTDEITEPVIMRPEEVRRWLREGRFRDAKTILGLLYYFCVVSPER